MKTMLENFTEKITIESVVAKLKSLPRPLNAQFDLPINLETDEVIEWADVWILLHGLEDDNPSGWSLYVGDDPWHYVPKTWYGKSCLIAEDLRDNQAFVHIANELIEDLKDNFTDENMPELLRD